MKKDECDHCYVLEGHLYYCDKHHSKKKDECDHIIDFYVTNGECLLSFETESGNYGELFTRIVPKHCPECGVKLDGTN